MSDVLLRFENLLENTEGPTDDTTWTTNVEIPDDIFVGFNIGDMVELSLGGDRPIEDVINQFKWTKTEQNVSNYLQKNTSKIMQKNLNSFFTSLSETSILKKFGFESQSQRC